MHLIAGFSNWRSNDVALLQYNTYAPCLSNIRALFWLEAVEAHESNLLVRGPSTQVALPHSANQIKAVAGQDQPLFYVAEKALWTIDGRLALSNVDLAAVNAHGQILILNESERFILYESAEELETDRGQFLEVPSSCGTPCKLVGGSAQFMILTSAPQHAILTYSSHDNRFGQLGSRAAPLCTMHQVEFFDGLRAVDIAAGDMHCAVRTVDGALYVFGSDAQGQCGGCSSGEPELVEVPVSQGEEQPDFVSMACGSAHTVAITSEGQVWATGQNHYGQLGMGDQETRYEFQRCPLAFDQRACEVLCSRWTTAVRLL